MYSRFFQLTLIAFIFLFSSCWKRNLKETTDSATDPDELEVWDEVDMDPEIIQPSIWDITTRHGSFETFSQLAESAGLEETFNSDLRMTLLAPTDEAFNQLPEGTVALLLKEENQSLLIQLLLNHVIPEVFHSVDLMDGETASALSGNDLIISKDKEIKLGTATITAADISASNGVVHVVDQVIIGE